MCIKEGLPDPVKGLLNGEYWLLSIDFERAYIRIRKARDRQYDFKDRMNKIVWNDPNLLRMIAEQVW